MDDEIKKADHGGGCALNFVRHPGVLPWEKPGVSEVSLETSPFSTVERGEKGATSVAVGGAGGEGGLPRLRRPLGRWEVGETVDLRSDW
jgi:hypothetical protein